MNFQISKQIAAENIHLDLNKFKSELLLEAFIYENPKIFTYEDFKIITSQFHLYNGRPTKETDGRIDLIGLLNNEDLIIIEVKKDEINNETIGQLKDYLKAVKEKQDNIIKELKEKENNIAPDLKIKNIIGIVIGQEINPEIVSNIEAGNFENEISAIVVKRYSTIDNLENYIITTTYAKATSKFSSKRYNNIQEYLDNLTITRNIDDNIKRLIQKINDKITQEFSLESEQINYTNRDISFNIEKRRGVRKTVFCYLVPSSKKVDLFVSFEGEIPKNHRHNVKQETKRVNKIVMTITDNKVLDNLFKYIENSYRIINSLALDPLE